ncbi:MAG: TlpA family protein disulfide reductase [Clostridiales bacterium]|nr:TlpA family protein disulfide reductase [Clostridiales bacterium]
MKLNRTKPLVTLAVMILLLSGAGIAYKAFASKSNQPTYPEEELILAYDFLVYDSSGSEVRLSDHRGTPVVVNFWTSWCPPCVSELPDFNDVWRDKQGEVLFMMVNVTDGKRETQKTAEAFLLDGGFDFPAYFDLDLDAAEAYGVSSIPMTFFIDKYGYFVAYTRGAIDAALLGQGIDMTIEAGGKRRP